MYTWVQFPHYQQKLEDIYLKQITSISELFAFPFSNKLAISQTLLHSWRCAVRSGIKQQILEAIFHAKSDQSCPLTSWATVTRWSMSLTLWCYSQWGTCPEYLSREASCTRHSDIKVQTTSPDSYTLGCYSDHLSAHTPCGETSFRAPFTKILSCLPWLSALTFSPPPKKKYKYIYSQHHFDGSLTWNW